MMPNTALGLFLLGVGGALRAPENAGRAAKAVSVLVALAVLAVGVATLAEYLLPIDLGIDRALIRVHGGPHPGRPSPVTALTLTLLSSGLLVFDAPSGARIRPAECFVLLGGVAAFSALIGFAFGAGPLYRLTRMPMIGVAPPTAVALLVISTGMLLERPAAGLMSVAASPGMGGVLLRRLVIPALVLPALLGVAVTRIATAAGAGEPSIQVAILAAATSVVSLVLLALVASPLDRIHVALEESQARHAEIWSSWRRTESSWPTSTGVTPTSTARAAGCSVTRARRSSARRSSNLIAPGEVEPLWQSRAALLEGGTHIGEWHLRRKDGSYLPVEVSARILAGGRWQGFVRDISERTRARAELAEAQERLELALEGADLATWDWNVVSGKVVFNARWAEMRGFRLDEVPGHVDTWAEGIHPEDWPDVKKQLDGYLRGEIPGYEAEMRVRPKSGQWIWILDRGKVFARDERGQPTRMVGTELDVTARKNAEAALRIAEAKSSRILSMSADAIISTDTDRRITMFNEAAERIFGYSKGEAMGASLDILIPERLRAEHPPVHRAIRGRPGDHAADGSGRRSDRGSAQERAGVPRRGCDLEAHG